MRAVEAVATDHTITSRALLVWAVLAVANVAVGLALVPFRLADFNTVHRWTTAWLFNGTDLYALRDSVTDYPPNAIVILAPLALLPVSVSSWVWALGNVLMAGGASILAARAVRSDAPSRVIALLALAFLAWSAARGLLQFSMVAAMFGIEAWRLSDRRPWLAGTYLGLAMMKPQVAAPYVLWMLFRRKWGVIAAAALPVAALRGFYCIRTDASVLQVGANYLAALERLYAGPGQMGGASELPLVLPRAVADQSRLLIGLILLGAIGVTAAVQVGRRRPHASTDEAPLNGIPGVAAAAVLVTFRHLSYAFITLLPAAAFLLLDRDARPARVRMRLFWTLQVFIVFDVPTLYRLAQRVGWSAGPVEPLLVHFDRGLMLTVVVALLALQWTRAPAPDSRLTAEGTLSVRGAV